MPATTQLDHGSRDDVLVVHQQFFQRAEISTDRDGLELQVELDIAACGASLVNLGCNHVRTVLKRSAGKNPPHDRRFGCVGGVGVEANAAIRKVFPGYFVSINIDDHTVVAQDAQQQVTGRSRLLEREFLSEIGRDVLILTLLAVGHRRGFAITSVTQRREAFGPVSVWGVGLRPFGSLVGAGSRVPSRSA